MKNILKNILQSNKSFDHKLLKATQNIERRRVSLIEMSRMLTIITSLITIVKDKIESKVEEVISKNTKNGLVKPDLAIHGWGPKMLDMVYQIMMIYQDYLMKENSQPLST